MTDDDLESAVTAALDATGVAYELLACDPDLADTADFCEHYGYPLDHSGNCIVIASRSEPRQFVACVVLATTRLDVNRTVRKRMGVRKASFASADDTSELTGMAIGGGPCCRRGGRDRPLACQLVVATRRLDHRHAKTSSARVLLHRQLRAGRPRALLVRKGAFGAVLQLDMRADRNSIPSRPDRSTLVDRQPRGALRGEGTFPRSRCEAARQVR